MNIALSVEQGRAAFPERTALIFEGAEWSYRKLEEQAGRAANVFRAFGVKRGDRVALCLPNIPEFVFCYLGALKLGAVVVSINPALTASEIRFMLDDSGPGLLVACDSHRGLFPIRTFFVDGRGPDLLADWMRIACPIAAARDLPVDAPAAIVYTSGTTGFPKGAALSHGNVQFTMAAKKRYLDIRPEDRLMLFLPLFHCFGQNAVLNAALGAGATAVLHRGFDAARAVESIVRDRVTMLCAVPAHFIVLHDAASPDAMSSVRYYMSAAAPLPAEIERKWSEKFGAVIHQGYGLTETSPFASYNHQHEHRPGSIGTSIEGVEMAVADIETGSLLAAGEKGEIVIRGPNVMLGYWNRPEASCQATRDGWFRTGDIGRFDPQGYFYLEGRLKDVVIAGGMNIYPAEVENALYLHPAVAEVAVFGVPHPVMGERLCAAVVPKPGSHADSAELIAHCRAQLAEYKTPAEISFVEELPKSPAGKVLKRVLREKYPVAVPCSPSLIEDRAQLERALIEWLAQRLEIEERLIDPDLSFADFGFTSLLAVDLADQLNLWTGMTISPTIAWQYSTVHSLIRHLIRRDEAPASNLAREISSLSDDEAEAMLAAELARMGATPKPERRLA